MLALHRFDPRLMWGAAHDAAGVARAQPMR